MLVVDVRVDDGVGVGIRLGVRVFVVVGVGVGVRVGAKVGVGVGVGVEEGEDIGDGIGLLVGEAVGFRAGVAEGEENGIGVGVEVDDGLVVTNVVAVGRPDGVEGRGAEGVVEAEGVGEEDVVAVGLGVVLGKVRRVAVVGEEDGLAVRTLVGVQGDLQVGVLSHVCVVIGTGSSASASTSMASSDASPWLKTEHTVLVLDVVCRDASPVVRLASDELGKNGIILPMFTPCASATVVCAGLFATGSSRSCKSVPVPVGCKAKSMV